MMEICEGGRSDAQAVQSLEAALARERARTREVDHRAKNSLQIVSSLLLLLSRRSAEAETRQALKAMHQRVSAIAAVHREILDSDSPDSFDLARFVREHVAALAQARGEDAAVRLDLASVEVDAARACPIALIALTHGSPPGRPPLADVVLAPAGSGFALTVQDQGAGLPASAERGEFGGGFGLAMVKLLAQQISANVAFEDARPGLRVVVTAA
jgi:two-component sensor histidine kinase